MSARLAAALAGEALFLWLAGSFSDFTVAGNALRFVPLMLGAGLCFFWAIRSFFAVCPRHVPCVLWVACVVFRLVALPMPPGDDFWRYLWEGRVQLAGHNPYLLAPSAPELAPLRDATWSRINHPGAAAIYPPLTQLTFAALAAISPTPLFFKLIFTIADLLTAALLLRLTRSHCSTAIYAWNPAVVYAFAGGGHFDSLMLLALTAGTLLLQGNGTSPPRTHRHGVGAPLLLGLAIALKLVPVLLLPVHARALRRRAWLLVVSLAIPVLLTLPYGGPAIVFRPLLAFAEVSRFNDLVWGFLEAITFPNPFARNWPFTLTLAATVGAISWKLRDDWPRAALWVLGAALLLSPVLHPWYATWILPLAIWRGQHAWTVLSLSALSAFLLWETTPFWTAWQPNLMTRALVVVPPILAWMIGKPRTSNVQHRTSKSHDPHCA